MSHISLIIPTYNGVDRIHRTLDSIRGLNIKELIVVVDGSTDNTEEILKEKEQITKLIVRENGGRSSARNTGAENASGSLFWFLDDDMAINVNSTDLISSHFEKFPNSILVGGQFENLEECESDFQRYKSYLSEKWQNAIGREKTKLNSAYLTAANCVIPKDVFSSLHGFNESLTDLEDYELAVKALGNSIDIFFEPRLHAWHLPPSDVFDYVFRLNEYEKIRRKMGLKSGILNAGFLNFKSKKWLKRIDNDSLSWMPEFIRYRLYNRIIASHIQP